MGALKNFGSPDYAHGYFSRHFKRIFVPIDPVNVHKKLEVRSFTRSGDNSDCSLEWRLRTPNLEEEEAVGSRDGTIRKSDGEFL